MNTFRCLIGALALAFVFSAVAADDQAPTPAPAPTAGQPESEKTPIARVGDQIITAGEFQRDMVLRMRQVERERGARVEPDVKFRSAVLNDLINGKVLALMAENSGIAVPEEEVKKEFERRRKSMGEDAYADYLAKEGLTEEKLKDLLTRRIRTRMFVDEKTRDLVVGDDAVKAEYERWLKDGRLDRDTKTADFEHIVIRPEKDNSDGWNAAKQELESARNRVLAGEKFEEVAKDVSEDVISAERGGTYFEATPEVVAPEFADKLFTLPVGELSEPFRSQSGWHIMKVMQVNDPGKVSYEKVKEELRDNLKDEAQRNRISELVKGARAVLDIELYKSTHFEGDESLEDTEDAPKDPAGEKDGPKS